MASRISRWSSGVGVSLSNGWMAIVRMCPGRPPPAKPYRVMHAVSTTRSGSSLETPDRGIERSNDIGTLNDERERTARRLVAVLHLLIRGAFDPLLQAAVSDSVESRQRVAAKGGAPMHRCSNVGPEHASVNAYDCVPLSGHVERSQRGPQERGRRNDMTHHVRTGDLKGVANENGRTAPEATAKKKVEAEAVGGRNSCHTIAPGEHLTLVQLP